MDALILEIDIPNYKKWNPATNKVGREIAGDWHKMANQWFMDKDIMYRTALEKLAWAICCGLKGDRRTGPAQVSLKDFAKWLGKRVSAKQALAALEKLAVDKKIKVVKIDIGPTSVEHQSDISQTSVEQGSDIGPTSVPSHFADIPPINLDHRLELESEEELELEERSSYPQAAKQLAVVPPIDPPDGGLVDKNKRFISMAESFRDFVEENNPIAERIHMANMDNWANELRLLHESGPTISMISAVISHIVIQKKYFIQSASGIRKHWASLEKEYLKFRRENRYA